MKDMLVYLSGPITARNGYTVEDNESAAIIVLLECAKMGIPCFAPHLLPTSELDYETWIQYDLAVLKHCTHMLMLPRWQDSPGALRERAEAIRLEMPIFNSLEEVEEKYGEFAGVRGATTTKVRTGTRRKNRVGEKGSDEHLQQGDSEGAHHSGEQSQD